MLINSLDRAMMENLKVFRNGSVGSEGNFIVVNHENVDAYEVKVKDGIIQECTCPHSHWRKAICKHMLKVAMVYDMDIEQLRR
jgi:SWIM zinc finger